MLDEAKRQISEATGLPPERMLMSGTHTHSSVSARWKNPLQPEKECRKKAIQQLESPEMVRVVLQAVRIGDPGIAAIPFEVFSDIGLELKARYPFKPSFTIEPANGGYGYLPAPEQHKQGGYETWLGANKAEIQASVKSVNALLEMFAELK